MIHHCIDRKCLTAVVTAALVVAGGASCLSLFNNTIANNSVWKHLRDSRAYRPNAHP
jgi:hypothetical protein